MCENLFVQEAQSEFSIQFLLFFILMSFAVKKFITDFHVSLILRFPFTDSSLFL